MKKLHAIFVSTAIVLASVGVFANAISSQRFTLGMQMNQGRIAGGLFQIPDLAHQALNALRY